MSVLFTRRGAPPVTYDPVFANNTWEQIIEACQSGKVPKTWNIADQKAMTINGIDYLIDIIGKNHDEYSDGTGKAPLTFQMHDLYRITCQMNSSGTNSGGWASCTMRTSSLPFILTKMPTEVQNGIREVSKKANIGSQSSTIETVSDKLFLLALEEVGTTYPGTMTTLGQGSQYEYYANGGSKKKSQDGVLYEWWTRSAYGGNTQYYCGINADGNHDCFAANTAKRVAFAFCF